jgi:hypothetical protein
VADVRIGDDSKPEHGVPEQTATLLASHEDRCEIAQRRLLGGIGKSAGELGEVHHPICSVRFEQQLRRRDAKIVAEKVLGLGPPVNTREALNDLASRQCLLHGSVEAQ